MRGMKWQEKYTVVTISVFFLLHSEALLNAFWYTTMKPVLRKQENSKIQGFTITENISLISTAYKVQSNQNSIYIHTTISVKKKNCG